MPKRVNPFATTAGKELTPQEKQYRKIAQQKALPAAAPGRALAFQQGSEENSNAFWAKKRELMDSGVDPSGIHPDQIVDMIEKERAAGKMSPQQALQGLQQTFAQGQPQAKMSPQQALQGLQQTYSQRQPQQQTARFVPGKRSPQTSVVPPPAHMMKKETIDMTKKITMTKSQLKETIKEALILNEKKKMVARIVREQIQEQVKVRNLADHLLTEGPFSGVMSGIKSGAQAFGRGVKGAFGGASQAFDASRAQEQQKSQDQMMQKQIQDAMKNVASARQKYQADMLKNVETMSGYHDAVVSAFKTVSQTKKGAGPMAPAWLDRMEEEVRNVIGQLASDLTSEKGQIDSMIKVLKQDAEGVDVKGYGAKATGERRAGYEREGEHLGAAEKAGKLGKNIPRSGRRGGSAQSKGVPTLRREGDNEKKTDKKKNSKKAK